MILRTDLNGFVRPTSIRGTAPLFVPPKSAFGPDGPIGRVSQPLTGPFEPSEDWSMVPRLDQGSQNSCGTTSLAMMLTFLTGKPFTTAEIDKQIRRLNSFGTAPADLKRFAEDQGIPCAMLNNSSISELKDQIAQGRGVMVSLDDPYSNGSDGGFKDHYVCVTGFEMKNGKEYVKIRDPNGDDNPNATKFGGNGDYSMPIEEFEKKWGKTTDGYNNFMMVFGHPGEDLPADRLDGMEASVDMASAYWNLANNVDRIFSPDDVGSFAHGVIGGLGAAGTILPTAIGWGVNWLGTQVHDFAKKLPFPLSGVGIALATPFQAVGTAIADISAGFSNAGDRLGGAFESLFHGDFKGFGTGLFNAGKEVVKGVVNGVVDAGKAVVNGAKDIAEGAVNAVKDVGSAIGDGVKKIFSGW